MTETKTSTGELARIQEIIGSLGKDDPSRFVQWENGSWRTYYAGFDLTGFAVSVAAALRSMQSGADAGMQPFGFVAHYCGNDLFTRAKEVADHYGSVCDVTPVFISPPSAMPNALLLAETIHRARWPEDRQIAITPFVDEDQNGREYCFRIARAILSLLGEQQ